MTKIPCLKLFLFFQNSYLDKRYKYRQHRGMTQFHACGNSFIYIRKKSGPKVDPCRTPEFIISPASEKIFSNVTKKLSV